MTALLGFLGVCAFATLCASQANAASLGVNDLGKRVFGGGVAAVMSEEGNLHAENVKKSERKMRMVFSKVKAKEYQPCDQGKMDYSPCEDPVRSRKFPREGMMHRERHCPEKDEELTCLIPPPIGYKYPIPWPQSRDEAWYVNVPHRHLTKAKADQNWIRYDEETEKFIFPGGGTMFHNGADAYIEDLGQLLPLTDGTIRTAIDTGCGVGSFGAFMFKRNIITMSIAPRDGHEAQVQFALERGLPAMISVLASKRLAYPARAFDLAHCSRCLIPWWLDDGHLLAEIDRILRPGGFWVLTGPPIDWKHYAKGWSRTPEDLKAEQDKIEAAAKNLCWTKYAEEGMFGIWQKPLNGSCAEKKPKSIQPPICPADEDPDFAWYAPMKKCISRVPAIDESGYAGGKLEAWPARLSAIPPRIALGTLDGFTAESFQQENTAWEERAKFYATLLPELTTHKFRNVMDMNARVGAFAAALADDPVWVMNVVPVDRPNTLGAIFERGLVGTYQDWCEAFSTYPRTYDLLHASALFSNWDESKCSIEKVLLEMDRLLRPEGAAIIREKQEVLENIKTIAVAMRWDARIEAAPKEDEFGVVLVCVKKYWTSG